MDQLSFNQNQLERIKKIISEATGEKADALDAKDSLVTKQKNFSSFSMLEVVLRLEESFNIEIPDDELDPDTFHSIESISNYIDQKSDTDENEVT